MMFLSILLTIFTVVELNCENLFDCQHDSLKEDEAFMPAGLYHWTPARYWKKINHIGQEILSCGEKDDGTAVIPDLVALCEVENDSVLRDLTQRSLLRNAGYEYVVTHSPDIRGIDVALLYSPMSFMPLTSCSLRVTPLRDMRPTRDILYVKGLNADGDTLHVYVVHAPSRSGGEIETRPNRMVVAERLVQSVDSVYAVSPDANIIVAGDFNDYSSDRSLTFIQQHNLKEISKDAQGRNGAKGTYKFQGEWGSLDHILLSPSLMQKAGSCSIGDAGFLLEEDEKYGGMQPHRNYLGPKWLNGFSDHLPLILQLTFQN